MTAKSECTVTVPRYHDFATETSPDISEFHVFSFIVSHMQTQPDDYPSVQHSAGAAYSVAMRPTNLISHNVLYVLYATRPMAESMASMFASGSSYDSLVSKVTYQISVIA